MHLYSYFGSSNSSWIIHSRQLSIGTVGIRKILMHYENYQDRHGDHSDSINTARLSHVSWIESKGKTGSNLRCIGRNWDGVNFEGRTLKLGIFIDCSLRNCDFSDCDLTECDFSNCDLTNARFVNCTMNGAKLSDTIMERTSIIWCNLTNVNLQSLDLSRVNMSANIIDDDMSMLLKMRWPKLNP